MPPVIDLRPARSFRTFRAVTALMLREMATSYGRSAGGYIWALLEPAGGVAVLTLIFSLAFASPPLGTSFPVFYATGFIPFLIYQNLQTRINSAISYSKPLLFYPGVTYVDAILSRFILNFATQIVTGLIVMTVLLTMFDARAILDPVKIVSATLMAGALGLGVGTINCLLMSVFPIWRSIWAILTRPLFIISCIFYLFDTVPEPFRNYLWYNPLIHIIGELRSGFYGTYDAEYVSHFYVYTVSTVSFGAGLLWLRAWHRNILNQ